MAILVQQVLSAYGKFALEVLPLLPDDQRTFYANRLAASKKRRRHTGRTSSIFLTFTCGQLEVVSLYVDSNYVVRVSWG
ncbi:hypothetical protein [Embleya sp. NPDC005575]|uniref:hypothetical protein n=1 Tax=Embleya sp. NPDC005575 TaxID=3156892 RepID=UPI0033BD941B